MFLCFFLSWWDGLLKKEGFAQENLSTCNNSSRTVLSLRLLLSLRCVFDNELTSFIFENDFGCNVTDSYFSLLNLSFAENYHISIFTTFEKQSMINRLSNPINRNCSAAKISKVMSSRDKPKFILVHILKKHINAAWNKLKTIYIWKKHKSMKPKFIVTALEGHIYLQSIVREPVIYVLAEFVR